jgi:hypothetical protein
MLKYVAMELAEGALPNGKRYIDKDTLLARRAPQVPIGKDTTYGMGLTVDTKYGTPLVHHGGDMIGFHSDMLWLPEHGVGAVILTNGDPGWGAAFSRKLLRTMVVRGHVASAAVVLRRARRRSQAARRLGRAGGRQLRRSTRTPRSVTSPCAAGAATVFIRRMEARLPRARIPMARSRSSRSHPASPASSSSPATRR